jgi:hypothetical protein
MMKMMETKFQSVVKFKLFPINLFEKMMEIKIPKKMIARV